MIIQRCSDCGKEWKGKNHYECEELIASDPCKCIIEASKMSLSELKAKIEAKQNAN